MSVEMSRDTLVYKFTYKWFAPSDRKEATDLCTFVRHLLLSVLAASLLVMVTIGMVVFARGWVVSGFSLSFLDETSGRLLLSIFYALGATGWAFAAVLSALFGILICAVKYEEYKGARVEAKGEPQPSIIGEYYRSFKDKVCPMIEFK